MRVRVCVVCVAPPLPSVCGADLLLKETMSLADSLYNLQLVHGFCRDNLNHCCHFSLEDMLYTHASVKVSPAWGEALGAMVGGTMETLGEE